MPRALLVGADTATRDMLLPALRAVGCEVDEVAGDPQSLNLAPVDVVLVVLVMLGSMGPPDELGTLHVLQQIGCSAPAVVLTPKPSLDLCLRAFALGATDVLTLPVPPMGLRVRLAEQVRRGMKRLKQQGDAAGMGEDSGS